MGDLTAASCQNFAEPSCCGSVRHPLSQSKMTEIIHVLGAHSDRSGSQKKRRKYLEEEEKMDCESSNSHKLAMSNPELRKGSHSQQGRSKSSSRHAIKTQQNDTAETERVKKSGHQHKKEPKPTSRTDPSKAQERRPHKEHRPTTPPSDEDAHKVASTKDGKKKRKPRYTPPSSSDDEIASPPSEYVTPASSRRRAIEDDIGKKKDNESEGKRYPKTSSEDALEGAYWLLTALTFAQRRLSAYRHSLWTTPGLCSSSLTKRSGISRRTCGNPTFC